MKRIVPTIPLRPVPIRRNPEGFAQIIMGKYGMTRWRDRILAFVYRKNRPLFDGGTDETGSPAVPAGITRIYHSHIHQPVYHAAKEKAFPDRAVRPIVIINHNSITNVTRRSRFAYRPLQVNSEKVVSNFKYSGSLITRVVHAPAGASGEPGPSAMPGLARTDAPAAPPGRAAPGRQEPAGIRSPDLALPNLPSAAGRDGGGQGGSRIMQQPQARSAAREALPDLRLVGTQLRTLQAYTLLKTGERPAPASRSLPIAANAPKAEQMRHLQSGSEITAAEGLIARESTAAPAVSLVHPAPAGTGPAIHGLRLATGKGIREVLGGAEAHIAGGSGVPVRKPGNSPAIMPAGAEPLTAVRPAVPGSAIRLLQNAGPVRAHGAGPSAGTSSARGTVRTRQQAALEDSQHPTEEAIVHLNGGLTPAMSGRRASFADQGAALAPADHPFPLAAPAKAKGSGLIHRMPEQKAPDVKVMQQTPQTAHFPDREVYTSAAPVRKQDKAKLDVGVEEINRLAERVYQVLEKRIGIQKDRRGLR